MDIDFFITITLYLLIILLIHHYMTNSKTTTPTQPKKKILKLGTLKPKYEELDTTSFDDYNSQSTQSTQSVNNSNSENDLIINSGELDQLNSISNKDELLKYLDIEKMEKENTLSNISLNADNKSLNDYFTECNNKYDFVDVPTLENVNIDNLKKMNEEKNDKFFGTVLAFDDFDDNHALIN